MPINKQRNPLRQFDLGNGAIGLENYSGSKTWSDRFDCYVFSLIVVKSGGPYKEGDYITKPETYLREI